MFLLRCLSIVMMILPASLSAHDGEHGFELLPGFAEWKGDRLFLSPVIDNGGGLTYTLRMIRVTGADKLNFGRLRSVLGLEQVQPVNFIRIDPGERIVLGQPDFRLELEGVAPDARQIGLLFDFGPDGALLLNHPVPPR